MIEEIYEPKSSFIKSVIYSYVVYDGKRVSQLITYHFNDGEIIEYNPKLQNEDTVKELFKEIQKAPSVGKHWHKEIKLNHSYRRIK